MSISKFMHIKHRPCHSVIPYMPDVRTAYKRWQYEMILDRLGEERCTVKVKDRLAESMAVGEAKGEAKGRDDRDMEIALKAFAGLNRGRSLSDIVDTLKEFDVPDNIIEFDKKQAEAGFLSDI